MNLSVPKPPFEPKYSGYYRNEAQKYHDSRLVLIPNLRLRNYLFQIAASILINCLSILTLAIPAFTIFLVWKLFKQYQNSGFARAGVFISAIIVNVFVFAVLKDIRMKLGMTLLDNHSRLFYIRKPRWDCNLPTASDLRRAVSGYRKYLTEQHEYLSQLEDYKKACIKYEAETIANFKTTLRNNAMKVIGSDYDITVLRNAEKLASSSNLPISKCIDEISRRLDDILFLKISKSGWICPEQHHVGIDSILDWWGKVPRGKYVYRVDMQSYAGEINDPPNHIEFHDGDRYYETSWAIFRRDSTEFSTYQLGSYTGAD